jgi:hypothetical protein
MYDDRRQPPRGTEDATGIVVLGACALVAAFWYVGVSRLHLRNAQCLELFLDFAILLFGGGLIVSDLLGRRQRREEAWPHPELHVAAVIDDKNLAVACEEGSTLLGYSVHEEPWFWPDPVRLKHGVIAGGTGAGKSTFLQSIIVQDLRRTFHGKRMPIIIFDGKGDQAFVQELLPHIEAAGRMEDLRLIDPSNPQESWSYNPLHSPDSLYQEHVNFIFSSFGMRDDFFAGHQEAYLSDLVRILYYTGKVFNMRDVLVMALDEKVLNEQIGVAQRRIDSLPSISITMRLNFEMSVKMIRKSLADRERIAKIQGLLNELLAFLEDDLSIVTGAYQNMLTIEDVVEKGLILVISLNSNKNKRASEALGKILLQNIRLMVGRRYQKMLSSNLEEQPILSVICDEIARYADPDFPQVLQTARGARVSFLFSFQAVPQLENVSRAFAEEVCSAPGTKMIMNGTDESTAQWFLKASSRVLRKRRSLAVRRTGVFSQKYTETGSGNESDFRETRSREEHIKNMPVGQLEILMVDPREGTLHSHLHARRAMTYRPEEMRSPLYPRMHDLIDPRIGANLRFSSDEPRRGRRRTAGTLVSLWTGEGA